MPESICSGTAIAAEPDGDFAAIDRVSKASDENGDAIVANIKLFRRMQRQSSRIIRFVGSIPAYVRWRLFHFRRERRLALRLRSLAKYTRKDRVGVEISPWCWPIVPKRAGYRSISLDIYDTEQLAHKAAEANHVDYLPQLEPVDFVGDACALAELIGPVHGYGTAAYIVSSHNFEHLPDPLRFLRGCTQLLEEDGVLTMALPDKRGSFDYYRPLTTTGDMIEAYFEQRRQPTAAQIFEQHSLHCHQSKRDVVMQNFKVTDHPRWIRPLETVAEAFVAWQLAREQTAPPYQDIHCSIFTPTSFAAIILDLYYLGLCDFQLAEPIVARDGEFFVHLRKTPGGQLTRTDYYEQRYRLFSGRSAR